MSSSISQRLDALRKHIDAGETIQAEFMCMKILELDQKCLPALVTIATFSAEREDHGRAAEYWLRAYRASDHSEKFLFRFGAAQLNSDDLGSAEKAILSHLKTFKRLSPEIWLIFGHLLNRLGRQLPALKAWFMAVDAAQAQGRWNNSSTVEPELVSLVVAALEQLKQGKEQWLNDQLDDLRRFYGPNELRRVDRAILQYLYHGADGPADSRQRPKFLYIPGLPDFPYHDPHLHPWADQLKAAFPQIRAEAISVLGQNRINESFLAFKPGADRSAYVSGNGKNPSWDAFFFYRHGERYDENHARCPMTSDILENIDLCRIRGQAPEVCFSLLAAGSHIMPHYGVTNSRLVMHLPLIVPEDCALNVIGAGEHHWREGELMMFDDTFQHEAWNRSESARLILLMDCWNPHLTEVEKLAIKKLVESISDFESSDASIFELNPPTQQ